MHRLLIPAILVSLLACMLFPSVSFTEDRDTVLLAQTLYALGKDESYDVKLALGTVVMNRVENAWFDDTLGEVLREQQQFPAGSRYDEDSLRAAHAVLSGVRVLDESALYYHPIDASEPWNNAFMVAQLGSFGFFSESGRVL